MEEKDNQNTEEQEFVLFRKEDIERVDQLKRSIITSPATFLITSSLVVLLAKKLKLRRLIANPLRDEADMANNDRYWRIGIYNILLIGTLGFMASAINRNEANKVILFKKYEPLINAYMKWRTDK